MINEPSAAGIEFNYRYGQTDEVHEGKHLIVYDLGGGNSMFLSFGSPGGGMRSSVVRGFLNWEGTTHFVSSRSCVVSILAPLSLCKNRSSLAASGIIIPPLVSNVRPRFSAFVP
ncbi:MAG: hypothetical protein U0V70_13890 [Terriglobia bacterium]